MTRLTKPKESRASEWTSVSVKKPVLDRIKELARKEDTSTASIVEGLLEYYEEHKDD